MSGPETAGEPTPIASKPGSSDPVGGDRTRIAGPSADATRISSSPGNPASVPPEDATRIATVESRDGAKAANRIVEPGVLINDNYRILKLVSAGGMGEVYRAENVFTGDPVAVKIILPNLARDESIIDLFRREARILVQMRDDAIVRYHNFVRDRGLDRYCLIMEFVEGRHLCDHIQTVGPLDADQALVLMRRLARGLAQAHARGVTHRDLSPDNAILRDNRIEEAVLIDFGIARSTELGDGLGGRFAGKFKYIAPEQLGHSRGEIGPPADVYGLALMIAAAMRGRPLDMGSSIVEASEARRRIPDLSGISYRVYPLLQHMLEPDPAARPRDMDALLRILDDATHLPARYRLPLWQDEAQTLTTPDAPDKLLSRHSALTDLTGAQNLQDSASPFADMPPAQGSPQTARRAARRGRGLVYTGLAITVLAVLGAVWLSGGGNGIVEAPADPGDEPSQAIVLPVRDMETRDGFLAEQPLPGCTVARRLANGPNAGKIGTLADGPRDFAPLRAAYARRFSSSPAVVEGIVRPPQCPALDLLHALAGRGSAPPVLSLDNVATQSGGRVSGRIRDLNGRSLWLFVVSPKGGVYDLSSTAAAQADGSFAFDFGISLAADEIGAQPQLIVALASGTPLASVAAAPAGSNAAMLLPLVLQEIATTGEIAAVDAALLQVTPPVSQPDPPRGELSPDGDRPAD